MVNIESIVGKKFIKNKISFKLPKIYSNKLMANSIKNLILKNNTHF